jgi:hypothetical protein
MSQSPQVAITIMTGGPAGPAGSAEATTGGAPVPSSLEQLSTTTGEATGQGSGPVPTALDQLAVQAAMDGTATGSNEAFPAPDALGDLGGAQSDLGGPTPTEDVDMMSAGSQEEPAPVDLEELAEQAGAEKPAPRKRTAPRKKAST